MVNYCLYCFQLDRRVKRGNSFCSKCFEHESLHTLARILESNE